MRGHHTAGRIGLVSALITGAMVANAPVAEAAVPGEVDASYGNGGIAPAPTIAGGFAAGVRVATQPDGRAIAASAALTPHGYDAALARYDATGARDTTFGVNGAVVTDFGSEEQARAIVLQPDGKIVMAASGNQNAFMLARYLPSGALDPTFGTGGKVRITGTFGAPLQFATSLALQPDGSIVVAGSGGGAHDFAVVRLHGNGTLDKTFSGDGIALVNAGATEIAYAVAVQPDDKIVAAGMHNTDGMLTRLTPTGARDTTFGTNGVVLTPFNGGIIGPAISSMLLQPDGKIAVAGEIGLVDPQAHPYGVNVDMLIARYLPSGALDTGFGNHGVVATSFDAPPYQTGSERFLDHATTLLRQADGKLITAGFEFPGETQYPVNAEVARYLPDGTPDSSFGYQGVALPSTASFTPLTGASGAALQQDGNLLLGCCGSLARLVTGAPPFPARPTVTAFAPAAPGPADTLSVQFSAPVYGVTASSIRVTAASTGAVVPGSVTGSPYVATTTASWTPAAPLAPGERYTMSVTSAIQDASGTPLVPATRQFAMGTAVENGSPALRETWDSDGNASASGGKFHASRTAGALAEFHFTGSAVTLLGTRGPDGGLADVYLDGVPQRVSFYNRTVQWKYPVWTASGLPAGPHVVTLVVRGLIPAGASAAWVRLDAFSVGTTLVQENSPLVLERFAQVSNAAASGGSYDFVEHTTNGENGTRPNYSMQFRGKAVRVYGVRSPSSGRAAVYIDNALKATIVLSATTTQYQALLYTSPALADRIHTLRIEPVGTATGTASMVGIDWVAITT